MHELDRLPPDYWFTLCVVYSPTPVRPPPPLAVPSPMQPPAPSICSSCCRQGSQAGGREEAAADKAAKLKAENKAAADEAAKLEAEKKAAADEAAKLEAEKKAAAGASPLGRHRPLPNQHTPTHLSPSRTRHLTSRTVTTRYHHRDPGQHINSCKGTSDART